MLEIPLQPVASQVVKAVLGGQNFQIFIYQKAQGMFVDINVDGIDVMSAVIARDVTPLISREYAGVSGNLIFTDTQGSHEPTYDGLGTRYTLVYLTAEEYAQLHQ